MNRTRIDTRDQALWSPDVTVATVVARDGRFLLVEERVDGELVLNQPAGHLEPDESLAEAARRESLEETGWDVEPTGLIGVYQWTSPRGRDFLRFAFAADAVRHHASRRLDQGIERTLWLTREEIAAAAPRLRSPMVLRCVDDWLAGRRLPLAALAVVPSGASA
ncbi:MAG TPA: NUDIX hydrolase [Rudaea sp.]|nr:NUDIX hydrolase [Rudaea sp.]